MDLGLKDKCAFVAASSRGLGFATALTLAREGCKVALNSREEEKVKAAAEKITRETGTHAYGVAGDVSEASAVDELIRSAVDVLGGLDILITNAGGPPSGSFEIFDEATWQKAVDTSFMSHVRLIRAALPHLRKSDSPSVLTMTSYTVKQPALYLVLSNSIRAATVGLTKSLALELGKENIRFNSILPGWTETERITSKLLRSRLDAWVARRSLQMQRFFWSHRLRPLFTVLRWPWMEALPKENFEKTLFHCSINSSGRLYSSAYQHIIIYTNASYAKIPALDGG